MTAKKTDAPAAAKPAPARATARSPFRETREDRRTALTHDQIAEDLAAFQRAGGRIEVLGNTPMLRAIPLSPGQGASATTARPDPGSVAPEPESTR
jgi:hypothetical protein